MPHFYRSSDEFVAAAQAALASAAPRQPVALLVVDVDPPAAGQAERPGGAESALGAVSEIVRHILRAEDHVGRVGDRLVLVLDGATAEQARYVGRRLCAAVRIHDFGEALGHLTISAGAAAAPEHGSSFDSVHGTATTALARVEAQGCDGAMAAPLPHHEALHRPLAIERLAGRRQELASLTRWLDEACAGQPRVVAVFGDTGTGTATLLRQLESEVRLRGGLFAMAESQQLGVPQPYGVWGALLRATMRFPNAPKREWSELQHLEPRLATTDASGTPTGSQYRLLAELTEYFRTLAAERPLVLVLDEMQWADGTSWDALEHLLEALDTDRLMICLAQPPESVTDSSPHRQMLARHDIVRELSLSRLTRDEVKQWLHAAFHGQEVAREFLAFLYRHTEGNPLFIAQVLRSLVEDGAIWYNGMRWEWRPVSELRLPAERPALIAQRLERFSSTTRAVLSVAAIIGLEFDVKLLVGAGAGSEAVVRLALSEAVTAGLIWPTYERREGGYAFAHEEIASVLLESIPRMQLKQTHQRVAESLGRLAPERSGEIALHYDAAGDAESAYDWGQRAAKGAERLYAHHAAGSYLQIAARNAQSPGKLAEIRVALAELAETGGRFDEVEELCDLAIEWYEGQDDARRALTLKRIRERARMELGQPANEALKALERLEAEARDLGFDREHVAILLNTSIIHSRRGDPRTAERIAAQAVETAEQIGEPQLLAEALTRLAASTITDAPGRANTTLRRVLELYERLGNVRGQARTYINFGVAAQFETRLSDAIDAYSRAIAVSRAAGMPDLWGLASMNLGVTLQKCGEYDRARELFGEALALFAAVKHSEYQLAALFNMAHVERELGLWESAVQLYEATTPLAQRIGQKEIEIGATAGAGLCALELRRFDEAKEALRTVDADLKSDQDWFQGRELVEALRIRLAAAEDDPIALTYMEQAIALAETADMYNAVWLITACVPHLSQFDRERIQAQVARFEATAANIGYPEMTRRYDAIRGQ